MFTKIAAALIAASVIAAPAMATTTVIKSNPAGTVKVIKHTGKHHVRHFHGKHAKIVKIVRPHKAHRAHVVRHAGARNAHVVVKTVKPSGRI